MKSFSSKLKEIHGCFSSVVSFTISLRSVLSHQHIKSASVCWSSDKNTHGVNSTRGGAIRFMIFFFRFSFISFIKRTSERSSGRQSESVVIQKWSLTQKLLWDKVLEAVERDNNGSEEFKICFCYSWNRTKSPGWHSSCEGCNKISGIFASRF